MRSISAAAAAFLGAIMGCFAANAASTDPLSAAIATGDWIAADKLAVEQDARDRSGDFFRAYVKASQLTHEKRCAEARPLLVAMRITRPCFLPLYELSYVCDKSQGDRQAAIADLDALLGALPQGPQHDLVLQLRQNEASAGAPAVSFYGDIMPSTNVDRQTAATSIGNLTIVDESRGHAGVAATGGVAISQTLLERGPLSVAGAVRGEASYSTGNHLFEPGLIAELPVTFVAPNRVTLVLAPYVAVGLAQTTFDNASAGARVVAGWDISATANIALSANLGLTRYQSTAYRNGIDLDTILSGSTLLGPNTRFSANLEADTDFTFDPDFRRFNLALTARVDHIFENGFVTAGELTLGRQYHSTPPPLSSGSNQRDTYFGARLELAHRAVTIGPFMPTLYYQFRRQVSDNPFYSYQSHDIGVTLQGRL
jgi:hypothetical protein